MDLKNNTVGIACGDFSAKCSDACIEKYNTGQLFGLDGIKADNPIKTKQGSSDASNLLEANLSFFFNYPLFICCLPWV
ncbi:core protein [Escherichia coli ISC7]|uniref:Core protein n=1 Tax=Escherichia coli ISC7 TaxID=1432555 RepID=W1EXA9_ECOLX|nr:core protein [Escherichia coli ISC7]